MNPGKPKMSEQSPFQSQQLRALLLPEVIYTVAGPYLVYRLASPYTSVVNAQLLAAVLPILRIVISLLQSHRISLPGLLSIFTIAVKVATGLVFQDARLI